MVGEAAEAYREQANPAASDSSGSFTRAIVFVKPELVIVSIGCSPSASTFEYWLHAANKFQVGGQREMQVQAGDVVCDIDLLTPKV